MLAMKTDRQTKRTHLMIIRHFPTMACKKMRNVYEIDESRPQDIMEHELLQFFELMCPWKTKLLTAERVRILVKIDAIKSLFE